MKTIGVREFIKGGYKELTEPVLVMSHSKPIGVWDPTAVMPHFVSAWQPIDGTVSYTTTFSSSTAKPENP